jgi:hypothetical protein
MTKTSWLPKVLRWMFTVFAIFMALAAIALFVLWLVDPKLPADARLGPATVEIMGQPGTIALSDSNFAATALHGSVTLGVKQAGGLIELAMHYGLPLAVLNVLFFTLLFDLLRRLFRNVGRGESFTRQSVRLVQIVGLSLLVFSVVSAVAEGWFMHAIYNYLAEHAAVTISGTSLHLPVSNHVTISGGGGSPFGGSYFFSGLLVLALSEVFRQGLALKSENDLTV